MRLTQPLLFAIATAIALPAQATPGRLNGKGCHNSKKAGYHCHRSQIKKPAAPNAPGKAPSAPKGATPK